MESKVAMLQLDWTTLVWLQCSHLHQQTMRNGPGFASDSLNTVHVKHPCTSFPPGCVHFCTYWCRIECLYPPNPTIRQDRVLSQLHFSSNRVSCGGKWVQCSSVIVKSHSSALMWMESQYSFSPGQKLRAWNRPHEISAFCWAREPTGHELEEKEKGSGELHFKFSLTELFYH